MKLLCSCPNPGGIPGGMFLQLDFNDLLQLRIQSESGDLKNTIYFTIFIIYYCFTSPCLFFGDILLPLLLLGELQRRWRVLGISSKEINGNFSSDFSADPKPLQRICRSEKNKILPLLCFLIPHIP